MKIDIFGEPLVYTLKAAGLWPDYNNVLLTVILASGIVTLIPFQWWDVFRIYDDPIALTNNLGNLLPECLLALKFIVMWLNRRHIRDLLRDMSEDYKMKELIVKWSALIEYSRRFCKFDYGLYVTTCILYYMQIALLYIKVPKEERVLLYRMYYPFEYKSSPTYEIIILIQFAQGFFLSIIYAMSECLLVALVLHIRGHIDLLLDEIDLFSEKCSTATACNNLESVIEKHLKVVDIVNKVEVIYTYVILLQVSFSAAIICILGFVLLTSGSNGMILAMKYTSVCVIHCMQVYCFCFAGQHLIDKSDEIFNRLYSTCWFNAKPSEIRALFFIMGRAKSPLILTAGNFFPISARTFTAIIKTAFSYLSMLRASLMSPQ